MTVIILTRDARLTGFRIRSRDPRRRDIKAAVRRLMAGRPAPFEADAGRDERF